MESSRSVCVALLLVISASLAPSLAAGQEKWTGPTTGPVAQTGKSVVYIASDLKNGSTVTVYRGMQAAARTLGWSIALLDGGGSQERQSNALIEAIAASPHAIVLGGFDTSHFAHHVAAIEQKKIVLVGWHAAKDPGPSKELFINVATNPLDVAQTAANFVIQDAMVKKLAVGVIIFNDPQFSVANAKTEAMKKAIESCTGYRQCKVLAVENMSISAANEEIPRAIPRLVAAHGTAWNYSLAINDAYFDAMNFPLREAKRTEILNVSAGDGSPKALSRIAWGKSQQLATVAEPLKMQAFQLADELNRAFAGEPPSGYVSKPILVTHTLLNAIGSSDIESAIGFEAAYGAIWKKK